jgi:hypothetical protein
MSKILVVKKEVAEKEWMKHMPNPLVAGQKVVRHSDQDEVDEGYVRVKHGQGCVSVFNENHFTPLGVN